MSQRTEPREDFEPFEGHPILCAADFSDTANAVFNPGATKIDGRVPHLHDGDVDAVTRAVAANRTRSSRHLAWPPGPSDSPGAPAGGTTGTA